MTVHFFANIVHHCFPFSSIRVRDPIGPFGIGPFEIIGPFDLKLIGPFEIKGPFDLKLIGPFEIKGPFELKRKDRLNLNS